MYSEIILGLITFSTLLVHVWYIKKYFEQEKKLVKAILSKNVEEFVNSEMIERPVKKEKEKPEELFPLSDLDDEQFFKAVSKTVK